MLNALNLKLSEHIKRKINTFHASKLISNHMSFLEGFRVFWLEICFQMQSIKDIFHFLERTVLIKEKDPNNSSFWLRTLTQLRTGIKEEVKARLIEGVLMEIQNDRNRLGNGENRELIGKLVHVMLALDFYRGKHMF
jgi:hypothetical protein